MKEIFVIIIFVLLQKLADQFSDYHDKSFKSLLFGLLEGIAGILVIVLIPSYREYFLALLIFWILSGKIDTYTHVFGIYMISISLFFIKWTEEIDLFELSTYLNLLLSFKLIKPSAPRSSFFYKHHLQYIAIALFGLILFQNFQLVILTITTLFVIYFSNYIIVHNQDR